MTLVSHLCLGWRLAHLGFGQMAFQTSKKLSTTDKWAQMSGMAREEDYLWNIIRLLLFHIEEGSLN